MTVKPFRNLFVITENKICVAKGKGWVFPDFQKERGGKEKHIYTYTQSERIL